MTKIALADHRNVLDALDERDCVRGVDVEVIFAAIDVERGVAVRVHLTGVGDTRDGGDGRRTLVGVDIRHAVGCGIDRLDEEAR
jgi:hypothetical protein